MNFASWGDALSGEILTSQKTFFKIYLDGGIILSGLGLLQFKLVLSHDGSGKGAALTAAVSLRLRNMKFAHQPEGIEVPLQIGIKQEA